MPLLTSARGAGTRQRAVPPGQPHLLAARVEGDRQPGHHPVADARAARPARNIRDSASTNAAALRWVTATPFGVPVEPEVKITHASSPEPGLLGLARRPLAGA